MASRVCQVYFRLQYNGQEQFHEFLYSYVSGILALWYGYRKALYRFSRRNLSKLEVSDVYPSKR